MSSGISLEQWLWTVGRLVPIGLAWCFALYLCFTRHRENPRGAVFLGLAILLELNLYALAYLAPLLAGSELMQELLLTSWYQSGVLVVHSIFSTLIWILVGLAVFPRRASS
jgi:hypothetical protein